MAKGIDCYIISVYTISYSHMPGVKPLVNDINISYLPFYSMAQEVAKQMCANTYVKIMPTKSSFIKRKPEVWSSKIYLRSLSCSRFA